MTGGSGYLAQWQIVRLLQAGYEVRATGFNPEAARYGGVNVRRSYVLAMAISGTFAGLAGAMDILGWQFRLGVIDIQVSQIGFIGIAVALLGACFFGLSVPTGLHALKLDPRIAAGPITLAFTDVLTLLAYFGLASVVLG